jgi:DnaJ family protein A protein 3
MVYDNVYFLQNFQVDPEELFRKIFGFQGRKGFSEDMYEDFEDSYQGNAAAQEIVMNLTFQQAARGVHKDINVNVTDTCPRCLGNRCEPGSDPIRCRPCNGTGMETFATGGFRLRSACRHCKGSKFIIHSPCHDCEGRGTIVQRKKVTVPVPAGIEDGQTVRMHVGRKDIFITFRVEKSDIFRRDGSDVHTEVPISVSQAILGGSTRIPGIHENMTIDIPPGTGSHTRIKFKGKGIPKMNGAGAGDHYVHIKVKVPSKLTPEQEAKLRAYAEVETETPGSVKGVRKGDASDFYPTSNSSKERSSN